MLCHTSVLLKNLCLNIVLSITGQHCFCFHQNWFYSLNDTVSNLVSAYLFVKNNFLQKKFIFI
ncbi:hypothetical protein GLYMA_01G106650v4 [Glycine max]|nr:hypothetical protein GLYMA_01G106650v4 [Glycine max]KAH1162537.1 hypothetical protein GYH30_001149 [Glycine max]